jgi:hypothetical protein
MVVQARPVRRCAIDQPDECLDARGLARIREKYDVRSPTTERTIDRHFTTPARLARLLAFVVLLVPALAAHAERQVMSLDGGWLFHLGDVPFPEIVGYEGQPGQPAVSTATCRLSRPARNAHPGDFLLKSGQQPRKGTVRRTESHLLLDMGPAAQCAAHRGRCTKT